MAAGAGLVWIALIGFIEDPGTIRQPPAPAAAPNPHAAAPGEPAVERAGEIRQPGTATAEEKQDEVWASVPQRVQALPPKEVVKPLRTQP